MKIHALKITMIGTVYVATVGTVRATAFPIGISNGNS